jgi:hypothetical protein
VITDTLRVSAAEFERQTGWAIKPEGACKDVRCVPLPGGASDPIDLPAVAERLGMPLVHDEAAGLWALGPEAGGRALAGAVAPELELPDWRDAPFRLSSLRGTKVLVVAWAPW